MSKKRACITGCGGFIGHHLGKYLKEKDYWIRGIDIKSPEWEKSFVDEFIIQDLRYPSVNLFNEMDEVFHLASNMGGIGWIENNKADIVFDNTLINMLTLKACQEMKVKKFLFTSSACVYPAYLQDTTNPSPLKEEEIYPADAEDGYGWEKLMMERTCRHFREDYGLQTYITRLHNVYGNCGTYQGGREKSPAALCRKVITAQDNTPLEIWGDGTYTRSYCYIDDCVEALYRLMNSDYHEPLNIGTDRLVSIDELADIIIAIEGRKLQKVYDLSKPQGVAGRNADITRAKEILNWTPKVELEEGLKRTYYWIKNQINLGK